MKNTLLKKIIEAQNDHEEKLLDLINDFTPLLKKYAYLLRYEDAFADLRLEFIEIILGIDSDRFSLYEEAQMLSYIKISVRNAYIKLSKHYSNNENNSFCVADVRDELEDAHFDDYEGMLLEDLKKYLTENEFDVIYQNIFIGRTVSDIASLKNVSRQAINQVKTRALKKLFKVFEKN